MKVSPLAGKPADLSILIDVPKLVAVYYTGRPDPSVSAQRVAFGTSGHRGCSLDNAFNEAHILAITQAICLYRKQQGIDGPLYIGFGGNPGEHRLSRRRLWRVLRADARAARSRPQCQLILFEGTGARSAVTLRSRNLPVERATGPRRRSRRLPDDQRVGMAMH